MLKRRKVDAKTAELDRNGTLNPTPKQSSIRYSRTTLSSTRGSSANSLRDAASASHRRSLDRRGDVRLRRSSPDVLSRTDRVHRAGSRRLAAAPARAEGSPQAFRRSCPTHCRVEDGRPNSHNRAVRARDSTALRYQRASSQSRTRPAEQKKTARSIVSHLIPARAARLRGIAGAAVRDRATCASAARFSVLVRYGLATWRWVEPILLRCLLMYRWRRPDAG